VLDVQQKVMVWEVETDRYHFLKPILILLKVKISADYRWSILSGIAYHSKV